MKKIYILLLLGVAMTLQMSAQQLSIGGGRPVPSLANLNRSVNAPDTLVPGSFGSGCDSLTYYGFGTVSFADSGYVFGNNAYGETECADAFHASGTVSDVFAYIIIKTGTSTTDSLSAKIYSFTAGNKPNLVLGTSQRVALADIDTSLLTVFHFATNVNVTTKFFASIVHPTQAGDTVCLVSTHFGCAGDSLSAIKIPAFGGWNNDKTTFGDSIDIYIAVVMATITGVEPPESNGLKLLGAFPNPAVDYTAIRYSLDNSNLVSITVFDLKGRTIKSITEERQGSGNHELIVDTRDLAAGNYYYNIHTGSSNLTGKFEVTK